MKKLIFLLLFSFLTHYEGVAQPEMPVELVKAYQELLKLKVKTGETLLQVYLKKNPENVFTAYLENYPDFIRLLTLDDAELYKKFLENEEIRVKKIKSTDKNSPYFLFCQAEIRLQWAFIKLRFGNETQAALDLQKSYKLLQENVKKYPDFLPNQKTLGLLHILIGSIPEKYQWMSGFLGLEGSVEEGLKELDTVRKSTIFCKQEAELLYLLVKAYLLEFKPEILSDLTKLYADNPDNLLFCFVYAAVAIKHNHSEEVIQVLHNCPKGTEYAVFCSLEYLKAEVYLQKNNYDNAQFYYKKFLKYSLGANLLKDSYYKIFLCNWLKSNELTKNTHYLDKVLVVGQKQTEADKYAQRFAQKKQFPNPVLMKSRLSFDGGYYEQAFDFLKNCTENSFSVPKDKAEFHYRLGRIYDKTQNFEKAILYYKKAIMLSEEAGYYFGANAALQLGYLYKVRNDKKQARFCFEKALHFESDEYRNSIRSKAKTALKNL